MTLAQIKAWVTQRLRNAAARWSVLAVSSAAGRYQLAGRAGGQGEEGADEEPYEDEAALYQHYGLRSRPGAGSAAISVPVGGAPSQRAILATEAPGLGPTDQEEWEVEIYAKAGQRIRLRADGSILLQVASGGQVQLRTDGTVQLVDVSGGTAKLEAGVLTVGDYLVVSREITARDIARRHDLGTGAAPTPTGAPGLTTATAVGTDRLFRVTIVVGGTDAPPGTPAASCALAVAYGGTAFAQVSQESGGKKYSYSANASTVIITAAEQWDAGTTHVFVVSTGGVA